MNARAGGLACALLMLDACVGARGAAVRPILFAADRIGKSGVPSLTAQRLRRVRAVQRATPHADRAKLIVALVDVAGKSEMLMYYGDPRHPDGVFPPGTLPGVSAFADGRPRAVTVSYHIIGNGCNSLLRPSTGELFAGTEAGCEKWKPSAADRAEERTVP
jgi:hypothetical protein